MAGPESEVREGRLDISPPQVPSVRRVAVHAPFEVAPVALFARRDHAALALFACDTFLTAVLECPPRLEAEVQVLRALD
jgi:hypothetical protein